MSTTAALIQATPAYGPSRTTGPAPSRWGRATWQVAVFVLAGVAGFILLWAAIHPAHPAAGPLTINPVVSAPSSEQLLSQLQAQRGSAMSPTAGGLAPASMTVAPVPLAQP
jgi:hypothetical protein